MAIVCKTESAGGMRQVLSIDAHTLYTDLEEASGGTGSAPGAHDYFDASLAACKALTVTLYARKRGMALDRVRVEVSRDASLERQGTYSLTVKLAFEGALTDAEKEKLHDIASRCPVHKLMTTTTVEIKQLPL